MIRKFLNKKTGKRKEYDTRFDKTIIEKLEKDPDWKELIII